MIAKIRKYFQASQRRYQMLKEARAILKVLDQPGATASDLEVLTVVMNIGLSHLRAVKISHDMAASAREMDLRIQQGPRPIYQEAQSN